MSCLDWGKKRWPMGLWEVLKHAPTWLIKISLKSLTEKGKRFIHPTQSIQRGAAFVSFRLGFSPKSLNNDTEFVFGLGAVGWRDCCTLSSCLNVFPCEPFMNCATLPVTAPSSCMLLTQYPWFLAPIVLTGQARWNQFFKPFSFSVFPFSCLQFFLLLARGKIRTLRKLWNAAQDDVGIWKMAFLSVVGFLQIIVYEWCLFLLVKFTTLFICIL